MDSIGNLLIRVGADVGGFTAAMSGLNQKLAETARKADESMSGFKRFSSQLNDIGNRLMLSVTAPLAGMAAMAIKSAADMESLEKGLEAVTGSAGEAARQFERMKEVAKLPGLGFQEAVRGAINLQAAGLSAGAAEKALKAFGNALATVGKGKADLDGVILALGQIAAKGKVSAEEINQLQERLPQIRQAMKAAFGTADTEALQKMGIGAQEFIEKITAEFAKAPAVTKGLKSDLETLQDKVKETFYKMGLALKPFMESALKAIEPMLGKLTELAEGFAKLPPWVQQVSIGILALAAASGPLVRLQGLVTGLIPLLTSPTGLAVALGTVVVGAVAAAVIKFQSLDQQMEELEYKLKNVGKTANDVWEETWRRLPLEDLKKLAQESGGAFEKWGKKVTDAIGITVTKVEQTTGATNKLQQAFDDLGIKSTAQLTAAVQKAEAALRTIEAAFRDGAASQQDVAQATAEYERALAALEPVVEQVRLKYMGLAETLREIERSKAARKLAAEWDEVFRRAEAWRRGESPELPAPPAVNTSADVRKMPPFGVPGPLPPAEKAAQQAAKIAKTVQAAESILVRFGKRVEEVFNDAAKSISDLIWKGGKFKDIMVNAAQEIGKAFTRLALEETFKAIGKQLGALLRDIPLVGKALSAVFPGMGGAASAAGKVAGAGTGAGGVAGGAASAASGLMGTIGAVGGVVSAVSGVIGNFQMHGMNKTLDLIEKSTRYAEIHVFHILEKLNEFIPNLKLLLDYSWGPQLTMLMQINDSVQGLKPAAGGTVTINMAGASFIGFRDLDEFLNELVRRLKQKGA